MRAHIERHYWFEFGTYPDGRVDIADTANSSLIEGVPSAVAAEIIKAHNAALEAIDDAPSESR